jgi:hypothetical protein
VDIVRRAKAVVLSPASEWRTIAPESGDAAYLFANYVAILGAIPPACEFARRLLFGWRGPRFGLRYVHHHGLLTSLFTAFLHYLAAFVVVYALAVVIDGLAPTFSAEKNRENAMKLAVYSMTPAWLAGIFALVPGFGVLRALGLLYAVYVFWLGLPILMRPPADKRRPYALAVVACGVVLFAAIAAVVGPVP